MFSVDRVFLCKLILVNKWGFVHYLNNIRLKETHCACASNRSVGPYVMYIEDLVWSFDRGIGFRAVYKKKRNRIPPCKKFKFYSHAQQLKKEED